MLRVLTLTILVVFSSSIGSTLAQSRPVSTKFDEYGSINSEDHSARLDNFATTLASQPGSRAYILTYAPEESAKQILEVVKDYLINVRGIASDRIMTVYGGRNDVLSQPRIQLWITPPGASRPKTLKFKSNLETFRGLFYEKNAFDFEVREPLSEEESKKLRFPVVEADYSGPSVANVTHAALAEVLKQQQSAVAYIVGYNGEESAPRAWKRIAQHNIDYLRKLGVEADRLKMVYGGKQQQAKVQFWVKAADAPPPVTDAGPEQLPSKAVSIAWIADAELGYSGVERQAFKQLAEVLRQFPTARACVVVTFGTYEETSEAAEPPIIDEEPAETDLSTEPEGEPEPEPADVAKLVENWKDELAKKHNIGADRFVVLFSRNDGFSNNMLEAFVVPPGADLPNPDAMNEKAPPDQPLTPSAVPSVKADLDRVVRIGKPY